ncbi:MAG: DEAD/DEAH box helicase [archaeon]
MVIASPTASGKTIIAELTGLESILNRGKKAMYTGPLRALASEHYQDLKRKYGDSQKIKMAVSTGDLDSSSKYLSQYDFIFTTYEKLDSLLIHRSEWLQQVGVLIIDEVHELDSDRGATLEMVITKLRILNPKLQIVALSATIPNADELAVWLKAELVESDYRPVPLKEGVHYHETLVFKGGGNELDFPGDDPIDSILTDTLKQKKQALVFANTRKRAESLAKQSGEVIFSKLTPEEKKSLEKIASKIENILESPTEQCKKLASLVRSGVAFHHAGLVQHQRELVEDNFREGIIKVISSTPTLAAGINLPAFRVIITSLQRYDFGGMVSIPVREYRQMAGRCVAGDTLVYTNEGAKKIEEIANHYFKADEVGQKDIETEKRLLGVDIENGHIREFKVTKVWKRKTDKLIEIETRSGKRIKSTEEHPLLCFTKINAGKPRISRFHDTTEIYKKVFELRENYNYGPAKIASLLQIPNKEAMIQHWLYEKRVPLNIKPFEWKEAKELIIGTNYTNTDYLSCPINFEVTGKIQRPIDLVSDELFLKKGNIVMNKTGHQWHKFPEEWSENLCRFIAKIMSDGNIYYNIKDNSYLIRYYNKDYQIQEEYRGIVSVLFGKDIKKIIWRRGSHHTSFKSLAVGNFFKNIGVPAGKKSFILKLPEVLYYLPKEMVKAFIKEYSDCDGWETKVGYFMITSSERLARELCLLLSKIGYIGRLYKKKPNSFRKSPIWEVGVSKSQFHEETNKRKIGQICPDQIKNVKIIETDEYVYDVTLEEGHNFIANGLVIHNSGRPKYDVTGESIVLCKTDMEAEDVMRNYILGKMEEVKSKLGVEPVLRMHLLALIASRFVFDVETMDDFFSRTLYAHQYKDLDNLKRMLRALVKELYELEFIDGEDNRFGCTKIGQRVAELYLDPLSADALIKKIKRKDLTVFGSLFAITDTTEFRPYLSVSRKIEAEKWEELQANITQLPLDSPDLVFSDGQILEKFQTTQFLDAWIGEMGEQELLEKFNIAPGIIRTKLLNADWLVYGMVELAPLVGAQPHVGMLAKLRKRLSAGIKEELILLCELQGIGRVRARRLYNVGIKNVSDVKNTSVENLSKVIGVATAMKVKQTLGETHERGTKKKIETQLKEQKTLFD